jgi:hypothetical protein
MKISIPSGARLLLWASASFVLVVAALLSTALVYQARTGDSAEPTTQAQVDLAQPLWTLVGYALLVPITLAAVGSIGLARSAPQSRLGAIATALWVVALIAGVAYAITWHSSMHFTESAHGDSTAAVAAQWLVRLGIVPLCFLATGVLARQFGAGAVVAVCAVLAVGWVTAFVLGIDLPPALLAVAWVPLGIRILRRARRSAVDAVPAAG